MFFFLSAVAIFCGIMMVFSRNPIHSALFLIGCFFAIAGHYVLLSAHFLAVVHIIVYAGAIMVLFLFTLMLMNLNEETEKHKPALVRIGAVVSGGLLMLLLVAIIRRAEALPLAPVESENLGVVKNMGQVLLNEYLFPFEFISILLLAAMVGAVLLSKKEKSVLNQSTTN